MHRPFRLVALPVAAGLVALAACSPSSQASGPASPDDLGIPDSDYSLDALVEAAKKEGSVTVLDNTGKIEDIAEDFEKEYGIEATGTKMKTHQQIEVAEREAKSGNVKTDVLLNNSTAEVVSSLIPNGTVVSWMPPDLTDQVDEDFQDPLMVTEEPIVFSYNNETYPDGCPVDNIWDLVSDDWKGKVVLPDPTLYDSMTGLFNQLASRSDDLVSQAYEDEYGKPLQTDEDSATAEFVKQLAASKPLLTKSGSDIADAVGAPGQKEPFIGLGSTAELRNNEDKGYAMGVCRGLEPFTGMAYTKAGVIASGTEHPNASKLFIHYMMTKDGIWDETADGKISTNTTVPANPEDVSKVQDYWDEIYVFDMDNLQSDFDNQTQWLDFWRENAA